uniref:Uncharacterized protein n=1 Tax=Rhizophora mucronata TaxID=61149 RepID=A0A2P2QEA4_RHIMU
MELTVHRLPIVQKMDPHSCDQLNQ